MDDHGADDGGAGGGADDDDGGGGGGRLVGVETCRSTKLYNLGSRHTNHEVIISSYNYITNHRYHAIIAIIYQNTEYY